MATVELNGLTRRTFKRIEEFLGRLQTINETSSDAEFMKQLLDVLDMVVAEGVAKALEEHELNKYLKRLAFGQDTLKDWNTVKEVATYLGKTPGTIRDMVREEKIEAHRVDSSRTDTKTPITISRKAVLAFEAKVRKPKG